MLAPGLLIEQYSYDARIMNSRLLDDQEYAAITEKMAEQIAGVDGVKTVRKVYSQEVRYDYEDTYEILKEYLELVYDLPVFAGNQMEEDLRAWKNESSGAEAETYHGKGRLVGVTEAVFDGLNEQAGGRYDKEAFLRGEGAIAFGFLPDAVSTESLIGKTLSFQVYGQQEKSSVTVKWAGDGTKAPNFYTNDVEPDIVVCEELFRQLVTVPIIEILDVDYETAFDTATDQGLAQLLERQDGLSLSTKMEDYDLMYENELRLRVIGGSLCGILVVLTFLNYGNMMAVSIQSRRRELAAMQSIGMTRGQQKAMIAAEGLDYALIAGGISLAVGLPLSCLISAAVNTCHTPYQLPVLSNILFFAAMLVFCCIIPVVLYRILQKGRLIELLKR